jgi:hypothetical protein
MTVSGQAPRDLDTIMKEVAGLWQGAQGAPGIGGRGGAIDSGTDMGKVATDAARLQALFTEAQGAFTKLNMAEAATMAKTSAEAAGKLASEAKSGKLADAKASKASLGCAGCHAKFREGPQGGPYTVKTGK